MAFTIAFGAGSGALHAVAGPDHVLSLGSVVLGQPRASWRIGLSWGVGHAFGTLLLALPLLLLSSFVHLPSFAELGERLAGVALIGTAAWSWFSLRKSAVEQASSSRKPFWVGWIHGMSGAGSLVLVLPVLVAGSTSLALVFLAAFAIGSTVGMTGLTWAIAEVGRKLSRSLIHRVQLLLLTGSVCVGSIWLLGA